MQGAKPLAGGAGVFSGIGFLEAGSRGLAPGGVSGVSPESLSLRPRRGRTKKPTLERCRGPPLPGFKGCLLGFPFSQKGSLKMH